MISKREIKKKDQILEIFDSDKKINILIGVENNITDYKQAKIRNLLN